jgi:hypothetical protein
MWLNITSLCLMGASAVEADRAHNPKVAGSNPAPATKENEGASFKKLALFVLSNPNVASAAKAFAQFAPCAATRCLISYHELRFAFSAEIFLPGLHGAVTGRNGHGANLNAVAALLAEIGADAEGEVHVAVLAPPNKANCPGLPDFGADPHAAPTQNTIRVAEGIADFLDPTTQSDILNSA